MPSTESQPFAWLTLLSVSLGWRFGYGFMWTLAVFIAPLSTQVSRILTSPMNTVTVVGSTTRMECSRNLVHLEVDWEFAPVKSGVFSYIYRNATGNRPEMLSPRYKIDTDGSVRFDIVIESVNFSDAGQYRCAVGYTSSVSAQLIVLASDPVCETDVKASRRITVEGDIIQVSCEITYNGNWQPEMTPNRNIDVGASSMSRSGTSTTISPSFIIRLTASDNGETIALKTSFNPQWSSTAARHGESFASNVPQYQPLWNYKANVFYGVRNLTMEPNRSSYQVGDRLICSAAGNPSPVFQWTETRINRVRLGPILLIDESMPLMQNLTFKCTATNTVERESKEISDITTFAVTATPSSLNPIIIASTVAGVIALIVLLALGFAKAMRGKADARGDSVNLRSTQQTSCVDENYDMIDESNINVDECYEKIDEPDINVDECYEKIDESKIQSGEYLASDGYSCLQRDSSVAEQANYDPLQQYYLTLIGVEAT